MSSCLRGDDETTNGLNRWSIIFILINNFDYYFYSITYVYVIYLQILLLTIKINKSDLINGIWGDISWGGNDEILFNYLALVKEYPSK